VEHEDARAGQEITVAFTGYNPSVRNPARDKALAKLGKAYAAEDAAFHAWTDASGTVATTRARRKLDHARHVRVRAEEKTQEAMRTMDFADVVAFVLKAYEALPYNRKYNLRSYAGEGLLSGVTTSPGFDAELAENVLALEPSQRAMLAYHLDQAHERSTGHTG
jgi:hypothetical protein